MSKKIIELLKRGMEANYADRFRKGNLVRLPSKGMVIITGDLHGHRLNFQRIVAFADLAHNPDTHVILQEIIHGGPEDEEGGCLSYKLLFDVIHYKIWFPNRVHLIMGNHDTAFINNAKVMKNGKEMNIAMRSALDREFKHNSEDVKLALKQFLFSQALAVKCANGVFISHSLPADRYAEKFDPRIFEKQLKINDVVKPGSAYLLTWGRSHSQQMLNKMARVLNAKIFVLGHQRQEKGCSRAGNNLIIIASDHDHGCVLPMDLERSYTIEQLLDLVIPLAAIA